MPLSLEATAAWPRSAQLFARAERTIPGGVGSSARGQRAGWEPYPPFVAHAQGSHLTDVDGNDYIDYLLGLGPMLLGHRPPEVTEAVVRAIRELGTVFALPYELETEAAEKVVAAVPSVDLVRFANSGSEAVGTAVRLARAATGRPLILRFEGMYHGWMDTVYWSNHPKLELAGPDERPVPVPAGPGLAPGLADSLLVLQWNDPQAVERVMAERGEEIAAILTEPIMLNTGCILPEPGYLKLLRDLATRYGSVLIFDEVITGFRLARGGAQEYFGVLPDLTAMAKGIAGGFPVAAIGGRRDLMERIADGRYSHSGTYNGNVVAMAAVSAAMDALARPGTYEGLFAHGNRLLEGLRAAAEERGLPVEVQGIGPVGQLWFTEHPIRTYRDAARYARSDLFRLWWQEMLHRGVLFHPSHQENLFVSTAHTDEDIERTLEAARNALDVVAQQIGKTST
ncbi:MAG: aspartate aminotransferase family protein [Candidatus Limnocylindrales bacterium]